MKKLALAALVAAQPSLGITAEVVPFDGSWKEQGFLRLFSNDYVQRGEQLDVVSDGTVSLLWRPLDRSQRSAQAASWAWRVQEGVTPTDLTVKGGDDRNLAVYFVFVDPDRAAALAGGSARRILRERSARALIYVWGGAHNRGAILSSPYSSQLCTKVLRVSGSGAHREDVNLAADYRSAFGRDLGALVGLAISADSDDTNGKIVASVSDLSLK
ncbi:DUF3047 domain-containing protein [Sulfitobacter mediterraneus]|uniref:DUF3047 family protein n=1 Tax=Sulfitobacter mediterraneus TaxID=83219 RepID=A0A061SJ69_9RHOB|nr:DUF3047 domain-containing protein [Sulfitobacter mediterraneus]KAJ01726.1 hypothetical protein PM02_17660 [Sulfitobacter mediterraneus]